MTHRHREIRRRLLRQRRREAIDSLIAGAVCTTVFMVGCGIAAWLIFSSGRGLW